jgi:hypothetical protein
MEREVEMPDLDKLLSKSKAYLNTTVELYRLKTIEKTSEVVSVLLYIIFIFSSIAIFTVLLNIGIAIWLGEVLGYNAYGFFIVSGFYLLIALIIFIFGEKLVKIPLSQTIIEQILKEDIK